MSSISAYVGMFLYPGNVYIYLTFSLIFFGFLLFSFKVKEYFYIFIAALFFLGFWVKLNGSLFFNNGKLYEPVGFFDYTGKNYDASLLIGILGCSGFFLAGVIASFFCKSKKFSNIVFINGRRYFIIWVLLTLLLGFICYFNLQYGLYQKATKELYLFPTLLVWFIKWMLFIGLEISFLTLLNVGVISKLKQLNLYLIAVLFFSFLINITTLSRAFPLVGLVILFLMFGCLNTYRVRWSHSRWFFIVLVYIFLSISSILLVNIFRTQFFESNQSILNTSSIEIITENKPSGGWQSLLLGRWIGLEGVVASVAYPSTGIPLLFESFRDVKSYNASSFYDRTVVKNDSSYLDISERSYYAITLPGLIGYLNYSGIPLIVFIGSFLISLFSYGFIRCIEFYSRNFLVTGFCAYLLAYRWISFGYLPADTYLFFLAIIAGVAWSIFLNKLIKSVTVNL